MSGQSIGSLFVKLGFDVDDSKLKSFDDSIKSVFGDILKIAGISATAAGFYALASGAENNAVALRNLNSELGVNMKYAEGFASLWKTVNPTADINEGLKITAHMANYASQMKYGGGSEFGLFGGTALDNTPEKMMARLRSGLPQVMAMFNGDTAKVSQLLQAITGSPDMMNVLNASKEQVAAAEKLRDLTDEQIQNTVKTAESIASLQTQWDNFINHAIATLAPKADGFLAAVNEGKGFWGGTKAGVDWIGKNSYVPDAADWLLHNSMMTNLVQATSLGMQRSVWGDKDAMTFAGGGDIPKTPSAISSRKKQAIAYFISQGKTQEQAEGMVARLLKEDGSLDPAAVNPTSGAYGIAQWLGSRVKDFKTHTGHSLYGSSFEDQLEFMNYELTKGHEHKANEKISQARTKEEAEKATRDYYERPDLPKNVTNNVTISVMDLSDPARTAEIIHQKMIDVTFPTINKGGF